MKALGRADRRELVRLLKEDREHPDPEVRAVARAWADGPRWQNWTYRLPGWLIPWVGLVILSVALEIGQLVIAAVGVVITGFGLVRWNNLACARAIRRVYRQP